MGKIKPKLRAKPVRVKRSVKQTIGKPRGKDAWMDLSALSLSEEAPASSKKEDGAAKKKQLPGKAKGRRAVSRKLGKKRKLGEKRKQRRKGINYGTVWPRLQPRRVGSAEALWPYMFGRCEWWGSHGDPDLSSSLVTATRGAPLLTFSSKFNIQTCNGKHFFLQFVDYFFYISTI